MSGVAGHRSKPTTIGEALKEYLARSGMGGLQAVSRLISGWPKLVGPGIAAHSRPQDIKGGRLSLIVDSSAWMNQLSLLSTDIIDKVNKGLGAGTVTELRFRIGKVAAAGPGARGGAGGQGGRPKRRSLTPDEQAEVERAAAAIADPELRSRARRLLKAAASTERKA